MKTSTITKVSTAVIVIPVLLLVTGGRFGMAQHSVQAASTGAAKAMTHGANGALIRITMPLGLPTEETAKKVLSASLKDHHPQWVDVPVGSAEIRTFVIYPDLAGKAPVVVVRANQQGLSDWVRAVGTVVVNEGFIAVVPDLLSGLGPNGGGTYSFANDEAIAAALDRLNPNEVEQRTKAVRDYFLNQPGSNGRSAILDFDWSAGRLNVEIDASGQQRAVQLNLTEHAWHNAAALLGNLADPAVETPQAQMPNVGQDPATLQRNTLQELAQRHDIVANYLMAKRVADTSPRHGQWVDIPVATEREGTVKLHSWLVQPLGNDKGPVIVVLHQGPGMDVGEPPQKGAGANWIRALADRLAAEGYIAIAPDFASGLGPNGGNFDSFQFPDEVGKAIQSRPDEEKIAFIRAALDYALKLPRATGKGGIIGFCAGGSMAWESTAKVPGINAAVSYFGGPPDLATMAKIQAPVIAFVGDNDPGLAPRVAAAAPDMQKLGKVFEFHIYPGTTHSFVYRQDLGLNGAATLDSWPRAIAFFKKYLKETATSSMSN